jgi:hypothetical protein
MIIVMKLAVIGSRTFYDYNLLSEKLNEIWELYGIDEIISGGAKGADSLAERYALENEIPTTIIKPNYLHSNDRGAPLRRNKLIIDQCTMVIAFWDMSSSGTKNALDHAKKIKKYSLIVSV